ncbi:MAG: DinB family protein [Chloroflexota bacterium]
MSDPARDPAIDPARIADLLEAAAATILAELEALGPAARWRPASAEWSANECLGHLLEAERRGFNGRIRTILAKDKPALQGWDQVGVALARRDHERPSAELLVEFLPLRADSIDLVRSLRAEHVARTGLHDRVGELAIGDLLGEWVHHDRNHIRQILAVTQARVWPQMGNARRFVDQDV